MHSAFSAIKSSPVLMKRSVSLPAAEIRPPVEECHWSVAATTRADRPVYRQDAVFSQARPNAVFPQA